MYLHFDWSNNCGEFFHHELAKSISTILKRNISLAKLQTNKNAHAQINFAAKSPLISPNGNRPLVPWAQFYASTVFALFPLCFCQSAHYLPIDVDVKKADQSKCSCKEQILSHAFQNTLSVIFGLRERRAFMSAGLLAVLGLVRGKLILLNRPRYVTELR